MNEETTIRLLRNAREIVALFWGVIEKNRLDFPKPSPLRCASFTTTEAAEAVDALIRNTDPHFNRASKDEARADLIGELCDTIFMALSGVTRTTKEEDHLASAARAIELHSYYHGDKGTESAMVELAVSAALSYQAAFAMQSSDPNEHAIRMAFQTAAYAMFVLVDQLGEGDALAALHRRLLIYRIAKITPVMAENV